jgi:hypothetical protein
MASSTTMTGRKCHGRVGSLGSVAYPLVMWNMGLYWRQRKQPGADMLGLTRRALHGYVYLLEVHR